MDKTFKKYLNATIATTLITSGAVVIAPNTKASTPFPDVKTTDYFYEAVNSLAERELVKGYPDGTFKPAQSVTRGQAAVIIAGILGLETQNVTNPGFKDVTNAHPYYSAIAALANAGIIIGYPDGTYQPDEPIKRYHMAIIISNAFNLNLTVNEEIPFTDVVEPYGEFVSALYKNGVTVGSTPTTFNGEEYVTRGQLAAFMIRAENTYEPTLTINEITDTTITAGKRTYEIANGLRELFNEANKQVLLGAAIKVKIENGKIIAINSLELNEGGKQNALLTLDGKNVTIGSLSVNADFIQVKNLNVSSNVTLTKKVQKGFSANWLNVKGDLIIEDTNATVAAVSQMIAATTGLNINLVNSSFTKVHVQRDGVMIQSDKKLTEIVVSETVKTIQIDTDITIIEAPDSLSVTGSGIIDEFVISNTDVKVNLDPNVKINKLTLPKGVPPESIISNYHQIKYSIPLIQDSEGNQIIVPPPFIPSDNSSPDNSVGQVNKTELTALINEARGKIVVESLDGSDVLTSAKWTTQAELEAFKQVIEAAEAVLIKSNPSQGELNQAKRNLNDAITTYTNLLKDGKIVDKRALLAKVSEANVLEVKVSTVDGTDISPTEKWTTRADLDTFLKAISLAAEVLNNTVATQEMVNQAVSDLEEAINNYKKVQKTGTQVLDGEVDKSTLSAKIDTAKAVTRVTVSIDGTDVLTTAKWTTQADLDTFNQAILGAEAVLKDGNTQVAVEQAKLALESAMTAYTNAQKDGTKVENGETVDKTELSAKIDTAKAVTRVTVSIDGTDVLTTAKWTTQADLDTFNQAILGAEAVLKDGNTQVAVEQAKLALESAMTAYTNAQKDGTKVENGETVDKTELSAKIDTAKAVTRATVSIDGADVLTTAKWTTQADLDTFNQAILDAEAVLKDGNTQVAVEQAELALESAMTAYTNAQKDGTKVEQITYIISTGSSAEHLTLTFSEAVTDTTTTQISDVEGGSIAVTSEGKVLKITVLDNEAPIGVTFDLTIDETTVNVTLTWNADSGSWTLTTSPEKIFKDITPEISGLVKGSLLDGLGLVINATVTLHNHTTDEYFYIDIDSNGAFSDTLPDGDYTIMDIYSDAFDYVYDVKINEQYDRFTISQGLLSINGTVSESLNLTIPPIIKIKLLDNGLPVVGQVIVYNNTHQWNVETDENGELNLRTPNGEYTIDSIYLNKKEYIINKSVTVNTDESKSIVVDLSDILPEVEGTIVDETGAPVRFGQIGVYSVSDKKSYIVDLDEHGSYSLNLANGEYFITSVKQDNSDSGTVPMNISFTVEAGKLKDLGEVKLPASNFNGALIEGNKTLGDSYIYLLSEITPDFTRAFAIKTDNNGNFSHRLGNGKYYITGIDTPNDYVVSNKTFEVNDGIPTFDFSTFDIGAIEGNVQGQVKTVEQLIFIGGGLLDITNLNNGDWHSANVNSKGEFGIQLPDGEYKIDGFWSATTGWVNIQTINFEIINGKLVFTEKIDITLQPPY